MFGDMNGGIRHELLIATSLRNQRPIQRLLWALSPELKRPEREADHLPLRSPGIKNEWS